MPIDIVLDGTSTLDETSGLQTGADSSNSTDDTDVSYASLPTDFTDRLTALGTSSTYPTSVGASSAVDVINVTSDGPINTLKLTDSAGDDFDGTVWSGLYTDRYDDEDPTAREKIYLVSDSDGQILLGVTDPGQADETIVFAVYLDPDGTTSPIDATLWSVTFEPIFHPDTTSDDDAVDLLSLAYLTATGTKTFNFDALPSGQNLFGIVGDVNDAIVVTGELPVLKTDGTYTNASDTINTSKGGGPTTIGIDNQSFDPVGGGTAVNDGAFFTYVEDPDPRYLAGVSGGLNQNEADDADNVLFGNTKEVDGAFLKIVQVVGNGDASLSLTAYDLTDNTQDGKTFVQNQGAAGGSKVNIDHVLVYNGSIADANLVEDSDLDLSGDVDITITNGVASITGLQDGYIVVWETDGVHDQVLVQANTGSSPFDIGLFGLLDGEETSESLAGHVFVEDDGPVIDPEIDDGDVQFVAGDSDTHTLNGQVGTDTTGVYAITNFTSSFSLLDVDVIGTINTDKTEVQYFQDKDDSGDYTAGDVLYYTMSLTPAGSYTFTVNNAPDAPPLEFNFDGLPSGQNLFGMVADADDPDGSGVLFFGGAAIINDPGNGQFTNASDTINTSKGGGPTTIGVDNQMIDTDDAVYFTIVNDPDDRYLANVTGGLNQNEADDADNMLFGSLKEVDSAFFKVSQTQGNEVEQCSVEAFDITSSGGRGLIAASGQNHVDIVSVSVYLGSVDPLNLLETTDGSGNDAGLDPNDAITVWIDADGIGHVSGLEAGYVVAWDTGANDHDQVLITGEAGKFDIGSFGLNEPQAIPDHTLDFTVSLTDADGDSTSDSFQVSIDAVPYV